MFPKDDADHPDDSTEEFQATVAEQTEQELAQDEMDTAADRKTLDRIIRLVEVTTRTKEMGAPDCELGERARKDLDSFVSAACQRGARIFRSDMIEEN